MKVGTINAPSKHKVLLESLSSVFGTFFFQMDFTDMHSFVKRIKPTKRGSNCPHLVTKNMQAVPGRSPIGIKKNINLPIGYMTRFFWQKSKSINFSDRNYCGHLHNLDNQRTKI